MTSESSSPARPTSIRITPTTFRSTARLVSVTAHVRIAPTAIRNRLTGIPMALLFLVRVQEKLAGDPRVVAKDVARPRRVLLEREHAQAGAGEGGDDLAEAPPALAGPRALVEVALAPVHEAVDAARARVVVEQQQPALRAQRLDDPARPSFEVVDQRQDALARVDEVEAAGPQLRRERPDGRVYPENCRA